LHEVGKQRTGVALKHRFVLVNQGNQPLHIVMVKPGCGCLKPTLERAVLAPREQTSIRVEVQTATQAVGKNAWRLTVRYREGNTEGELPLHIQADLVRDVTLQPAALLVHTTAPIRHTLTLLEHREKPMEIRAAVTSAPGVEVRVEPVVREVNAWRRMITVDIGGQCPQGQVQGIVCLYTDDPTCPELKVPLTIHKQTSGRVKVAPSTAEILANVQGALPARVMHVTATTGEAVVVERVEPSHPCIRCSFASGPGSRATLRIHVEREQLPAGPFEGSVKVYMRQPVGEVVTVPVQVIR
jgi:hypothetical protein